MPFLDCFECFKKKKAALVSPGAPRMNVRTIAVSANAIAIIVETVPNDSTPDMSARTHAEVSNMMEPFPTNIVTEAQLIDSFGKERAKF